MFVAVVGLVRGHDLVGLAGEHGEVLAGFSLALFEGLFGRRCIAGGGAIGWFRRRISGDGRGSASAGVIGIFLPGTNIATTDGLGLSEQGIEGKAWVRGWVVIQCID